MSLKKERHLPTYDTSLVMSLLFSIIFILIYGWLVYKFTSPEIKEEFK